MTLLLSLTRASGYLPTTSVHKSFELVAKLQLARQRRHETSTSPKNSTAMPKATRSGAKQTSVVTPSSSSKQEEADTNTIYFWKPNEEHGYLGQWYPSVFTHSEADGSNTFSYSNAEQFMMHRKGLLFAPNSPITAAILETTNPRDIKALGRQVPDFDDAVWKRERMNIVTQGTYLKFTQVEGLKDRLLATENKELVEASPRDRIWGIGFGAKNAPSKRSKWGANLLGKALMEVRQRIREEEEILEEQNGQ